MKYFKDVKSLEDLKKQFKKLAMKYHPDRPTGDVEIMKAINNEYDKLFPIWKNRDQVNSSETSYSTREEFYDRQGWRGENYNSSYDTKENAKQIRQQLKKEFPDCKFSVVKSYYSRIDVYLMEAPEPIFAEGITEIRYILGDRECKDLNEYGNKIIKRVAEIVQSYRRDDSDIMIDYFNCNFYGFVNIGKWDKPFKVVPKEKKQSKTTKKNTSTNKKSNSKANSNEFKVVENIAKKGIELYFKGIPDANFRQQLKDNGFRWHPSKKCWYAKKTDSIMKFLDSIKNNKLAA